VDELALIRDTISRYAPLLIAPLSIPNSSRRRPEKIHFRQRVHEFRAGLSIPQSTMAVLELIMPFLAGLALPLLATTVADWLWLMF
jgi:hypothetical protein